jgi:hypothetical protein
MLRFFTVSRLALNPNLIFEIGSNKIQPFDEKGEKFRLAEKNSKFWNRAIFLK